jgi:hypothetical protein
METDHKKLVENVYEIIKDKISSDFTFHEKIENIFDLMDELLSTIETLRQENAALREKLDFHTKVQPMDTAPKDGSVILGHYVYKEKLIFTAMYWHTYTDGSGGFIKGMVYCEKDGWCCYSVSPVGWLPLPEGTEGL